jgi:AMMECR1 domain-containing protein
MCLLLFDVFEAISHQVALEARKFMAIDGELPQCDVNVTLLLELSQVFLEGN